MFRASQCSGRCGTNCGRAVSKRATSGRDRCMHGCVEASLSTLSPNISLRAKAGAMITKCTTQLASFRICSTPFGTPSDTTVEH